MLVLQRGSGWDLPAGRTASAVTATAGCPTLVTRSGDRPVGAVGVLVVLDRDQDPSPAIALAFTEASLRGTAVTVLDGSGDRAAARGAIRTIGARSPDVPLHYEEVEPARPAKRFRDVSEDAALMVVVRPGRGKAYGLVAGAIDDARCPVLMVAPEDPAE
jgi:hypothetical protein